MASIPIDVTVAALDNDRATLVTASGHEFRWPSGELPSACRPGDTFCVDYDKVHSLKLDDHEKLRMGRAILNEILAASPSS